MDTRDTGRICFQVYKDSKSRVDNGKSDERDDVIVALWERHAKTLEALELAKNSLDEALADNRNYSRKQDMLQTWLNRHNAEFGETFQDTIKHSVEDSSSQS
jgi:hypothetical protein